MSKDDKNKPRKDTDEFMPQQSAILPMIVGVLERAKPAEKPAEGALVALTEEQKRSLSPKNDEEIANEFLSLAQSVGLSLQTAYADVSDKIKTGFTLNSALITVVIALGTFIQKEFTTVSTVYWFLIPMAISLLVFSVALAIGIRVYLKGHLQYVDPMAIVKTNIDTGKPYTFFLNKWACTICEANNKNAAAVKSKHAGLQLMYSLIIAGLVILAIAFLVVAIIVK
jgi:hypothetical protein